VKVRDIRVEIDIQEYMELKGLHKVRPVGDNVMACCCFHEERSPSFGVNIDTGVYNCFGCGAKGTFQHLVKTLDRFDTVYDAETFLIQNYGKYAVSVDEKLELDFGDDVNRSDYWIDDGILVGYNFRHPYLGGRGIEEAWQRFYEVGYSKKHQAITIPWRDELGRLITVKFRSVRGKQFWYDPPLPPGVKSETLWGLSQVIRAKPVAVAMTEAEIDGMSVSQGGWSRRILATGIGGNQFNQKQANKLIRYLPKDTEIINFTDNDSGGLLASERISDYLSGRFRVSTVDWSLIDRPKVKDANDLTKEEIGYLLDNRKPLGIKLFF
jgi:DNA primase